MKAIDVTRVKKTRRGHEVRIYATDGNSHCPIHGAWRVGAGNWIIGCWTSEGLVRHGAVSDLDLIEEPERIEAAGWVDVYSQLPESVLEALRTAAAARDRYRREVLGVTNEEPTATYGVETQIVFFANAVAEIYNEKVDSMKSNEARLLGERINRALDDARKSVRHIGDLLLSIPYCDDELPPGSRLNDSHLMLVDDANDMLSNAFALIEQLTPEALENE